MCGRSGAWIIRSELLPKLFDAPPASRGSVLRLAAFAIVWACVVAVGFARLSVYALTAGVTAAAPGEAPQHSSLLRRTGVPTLIMVVHPDCPCSRASLTELSNLLATAGSAVSANVVVVPPTATSERITSSELWQMASHLNAHLMIDGRGELARQLGATTSGQVLLYDSSNRLQFSGGITSSRGHAGENVGRSAVEALIGHKVATIAKTPVFGCELY